MSLCCESCFKQTVGCTLTDPIILNIPDPANGTYFIILTRSDGQKYTYQYDYAGGDFEIDPGELPAGLLNQHGGTFTLEVRRDNPEGELLNLEIADNYTCVEMKFAGGYDHLEVGI